MFRARAGVLCFLLFSSCCALHARSSVLLRCTPPAPASFSVEAYAGKVEVASTEVTPSPALLVVLLPELMGLAEFENVRKDVLLLYSAPQKRPFRLGVLKNDSLATTDVLATRARLKSALESIPVSNDPGVQPAPVAFLDALVSVVPQLGKDWSQVLFIGDLPDLDPWVIQYVAARFSTAFAGQHIRASWFSPRGSDAAWLPVFQATGGTIVTGALSTFSDFLDQTPQSFFQLEWRAAAPSAGFVISHSVVKDQDGRILLELPEIVPAADAPLPSIERYAEVHPKAAEAVALFNRAQVNEENAQQIRSDLQAVLEINPRDEAALVTAAAFYEKVKDYAFASQFHSLLVEVRPLDGASFAALGHVLWLSGQPDKAEQALLRARELNTTTPQASEDLARIHLARHDNKGAIPYLGEVLKTDAERQDLWFLQADAAQSVQDSALAIHSLERALALGGTHFSETAALVRLYLASKNQSKALELIRRTINQLPADPNVRTEFAAFLDDLGQPAEAIAAWRHVLEVQRDSERAHDRIARLLLESNDPAAAEKAADAGLAVAPKLSDLYLVKSEALQKQNRMYAARAAILQGAEQSPTPALLSRLVAFEDSYGGSAAAAYARLSASLEATAPERLSVLERGFTVSLRDADFKHAESFAALLESAGHPEFKAMLSPDRPEDSGAVVPGGLDALAFVAHAKEGVPPDRFFAEYCRTVIDLLHPGTPGSKEYVEEVNDHFERIAALERFGKTAGDRMVINLSMDGKQARGNIQKVLDLLGIRLRSANGKIAIERGENKAQGKRQGTLSALALDEIGLEEALQSGKTYELEIPYEWAAIYPSEKLWRETFYAGDKEPGGFATALLRMPKMAKLYVGISYLDRPTLSQLLSAIDLKTLYDDYAELLYAFAPGFALQDGHAAVPGGKNAEPIWARMAGANPDRPGVFFRALLSREEGKLLAFFFTLSELDRPHQAFFTANLSRTTEFYKLFLDFEEKQKATDVWDSTFKQVLRSVPLTEDGHVYFPGSVDVWTVVKGRSSNPRVALTSTQAVASEIEDEVLLRLARTRYAEKETHHTELDNFLAVSRINARRSQPLDAQSALLLAQRYSDASAAYPYFADLTSLGAADFRQFFQAYDRIKSHSLREANRQFGLFHSLIEWICVLKGRQMISDQESARLFSRVSADFAMAQADADYSAISMDSARLILASCTAKESLLDDKVRSCLLGPEGENGSARAADFDRVLDLQKVPSLDLLASIYDRLKGLSAAKSPAADVSAVSKLVAGLPHVNLPSEAGLRGKEKDSIVEYEPAQLAKPLRELGEKVSKRKSKASEIDALARQTLADLEPQLILALAGRLYAYFLRSSDLIVSADPLLLRKHRYADFGPEARTNPINVVSEFHMESEGIGSYFSGGFATFGPAAGAAASAGKTTGGVGGNEAVAAQIAAIREAAWDQLLEADQRLVSLRVTVAREWIVESAVRPDLFLALAEETVGQLSLSRRADLLNGIQSRNWPQVWDSVTLPDLFTLGKTYLVRFKTDHWSSPATAALRSVAAVDDGSRLNILGAIPYHAFGYATPYLVTDAPYEEYERHRIPAEVAERSAEFKLFLAFQADNLGVNPSALSRVAESLAVKAFAATKMTDFRDWRGLLAGYASITPQDLKQALEQ